MLLKTCGSVTIKLLPKLHSSVCRTYSLKTHYEILGLPKNCSKQDIRDAFIKLSKKHHPDKCTRTNSQKRFVRILEAYNVLSKTETRSNYDQQINHGTPYYPDNFSRKPQSGYGYGDPSFWANRDKFRDRYYANAPYYGIRGIDRVRNVYIAFICFIFASIGALLQFWLIKHSVTLKREALMKKSMENQEVYENLKNTVHIHGNDMQIKVMEEKLKRNAAPFSK